MILTTTVDNSAESTGYSSNSYACENTEDKIFLLSYQDVINANYGFLSDNTRQKKTTDYAQAHGAYTNTSNSYAGNGMWWLRSPSAKWLEVLIVDSNGSSFSYYTDFTFVGVVPALQIRLAT